MVVEADTWIPGYNLNYNGNGGSTPGSKTVIYGDSYGTLATSSRTGHTFKGWFTSASGGTQITAETRVAIDNDQTLYAHWEKNQYTVTLKNTDGMITTMTGGGTYYYGDSVTIKATPKARYTESSYTTSGGTRYKKTHSYSFVKWTGSGIANSTSATYTFTMPAGNVTLTASGKDTTGSSGTQYYLTVNKGTGVATVTGAGWYNSGATATVGATYSSGYKASSGTGSYTMNAAKTVTVTAQKNYHTIYFGYSRCPNTHELLKSDGDFYFSDYWCGDRHTLDYSKESYDITDSVRVYNQNMVEIHGVPTLVGSIKIFDLKYHIDMLNGVITVTYPTNVEVLSSGEGSPNWIGDSIKSDIGYAPGIIFLNTTASGPNWDGHWYRLAGHNGSIKFTIPTK